MCREITGVVTVLGFDIGGANTKAAYLRSRMGLVTEFRTASEYFPFWKRDMQQLRDLLVTIKHTLAGSVKIDSVVVTMTAELSDIFPTKRDGVFQILDAVVDAFESTHIWVLDTDANLKSIEEAKEEPLKVASANWVATGWMVAQHIRDCVIIDVGSTSTSIIPVINGKIAAKGKTDLEKLIAGELVYTGSLRTNIATIVQKIPLRDGLARVSSELFAQSGDVHLILRHIAEAEYTSDTADGRDQNRANSLARLARTICADSKMLTESELIDIAKYIYDQQLQQIAEGITQVYSNLGPNAKASIPAVVTGLGKDFLSFKSAEKANIKKILDVIEILPKEVALVSPATGVTLMVANKLEWKGLRWTP